MKRSRLSEKQIIGVLREQEAESARADVCRKHGISPATFYQWKAKFGALGSGLIAEPEGDGGCDTDCREEGVGAAVVACCDPPPVLETAERVFDPVPLAIEDPVVRQGDPA